VNPGHGSQAGPHKGWFRLECRKDTANVVPRAGVLLYVCLVALALAWAVVSLTYPFGWDHGILAWVGEGINQGQMPYRDRWDIKGPLAFQVFSLAQLLFGHNLWGIRLIDLVVVLSAAVVLGITVSHFTNKIVARWAAALFILWYASGSYWHTAQPDGWASMLMLFASAPLVDKQSDPHGSRLFIAGVLIGCSILIKPIYVMFALVVFASILSHGWTGKGRILSRCSLVLAGLVIPLALCLGWFAYQGALRSLFDVWIVYPLKVYGGIIGVSPLSRIRGFVEYFLTGEVISVMLPLVGLGMLSLWRSKKTSAIVMILWTIVAAFCVILQGRFFTYHWLVIYPPAAFFCAVGFHALFFRSSTSAPNESLRPHGPLRVIASMLLLVLIFHATVRPTLEVVNWLAFVSHRVSREQYYAGFGVPGPEMQAADYLLDRTGEDDRVFIWGWDTTILYLSDRQTISRFGFSMPLVMGEGTTQREAYRQEFLESLYTNPPVYIVVAPQSDVVLGGHYDLSNFGQLAEFVSSRYVEEKRFGDLALHRIVER
jgi:hypothetical protein